MSGLTSEESRRRDDSLRRALDNPMPPGLKDEVADVIEPHTMNMEIKHGDVMTCIAVAFPVIRDWFRDHPGT